MHTNTLRSLGLTLLSCCAASACAEILGEVCIEDAEHTCGSDTAIASVLPDAGAAGAGIAVSTAQAACGEPGALRCSGAEFQKCVQGSRARGWLTLDICDSPVLCSTTGGVAGCLPPVCKSGDMRCQGASLQACNEARTAYEDLAACPSAGHCSAGARTCLSAPCAPGMLRCNGAELQRCRADQLDWEAMPGGSCATPELCEAARAQATADSASSSVVCPSPICDAAATRCAGSTLERCNSGRSGWVPLQTCASAAACEAGRANAGAGAIPTCGVEAPAPGCTGDACNDDACSSNRCTPNGQFIACVNGEERPPQACADTNECTADACTLTGCTFRPTAGICGLLGLCSDGVCVGLGGSGSSGSGSGSGGSNSGPGNGNGNGRGNGGGPRADR
jgi:hypothetical protein